jgi:hypothetical protein
LRKSRSTTTTMSAETLRSSSMTARSPSADPRRELGRCAERRAL